MQAFIQRSRSSRKNTRSYLSWRSRYSWSVICRLCWPLTMRAQSIRGMSTMHSPCLLWMRTRTSSPLTRRLTVCSATQAETEVTGARPEAGSMPAVPELLWWAKQVSCSSGMRVLSQSIEPLAAEMVKVKSSLSMVSPERCWRRMLTSLVSLMSGTVQTNVPSSSGKVCASRRPWKRGEMSSRTDAVASVSRWRPRVAVRWVWRVGSAGIAKCEPAPSPHHATNSQRPGLTGRSIMQPSALRASPLSVPCQTMAPLSGSMSQRVTA